MNRKRLARSSLVKAASASSRTRPRATTLASVVSISRPPFTRAPQRDLRLPGRCCRSRDIRSRLLRTRARGFLLATPMYQSVPDSTFATRRRKGYGRIPDLEREAERLFQQVPAAVEEHGAPGAVEDAVVARQRHR